MQVLSSLDEITANYDAILCDAWGVLHNGRTPYPLAGPALARFRAAGKHVVVITNVPKPRGPIPRQLERMGFPRDAWDAIVTSGDAIRAELAARAPGPIYRIEPPGYDETLWAGLGLVDAPLERAAFIGISGLVRDDETPADYAEICKQARARDLEMLCANPDIVVQFGDKLIWCAGAVARDYAAMGGRVVMAGKPYAPIYDLAYREILDRRRLAGKAGEAEPKSPARTPALQEIDKTRILAIGDGVGTDVRGAQQQGLDCVFIASGMHGEALWTGGAVDLKKVDAAFAKEGVGATYVMRELA